MYSCEIICLTFLDGTLSGLLTDPETKEISGLPLDQSLYYLQQILYAVRYLHQKTILHLDLKCKKISLILSQILDA